MLDIENSATAFVEPIMTVCCQESKQPCAGYTYNDVASPHETLRKIEIAAWGYCE